MEKSLAIKIPNYGERYKVLNSFDSPTTSATLYKILYTGKNFFHTHPQRRKKPENTFW